MRGIFHPLKGKKYSEEEIKRMRKNAKIGKEHPSYGKKRSPETIRKMSESTKGRKMSPEWLEKLRIGRVGRKLSEEHKRNISKSNKGRKQTPQAIEKQRMGQAGVKKKFKLPTSSSFVGVSFEKSSNRWMAQINIKNKNIKIGRFKFEEDAFLAYVDKLVEVYGKDRLKNFSEHEELLKKHFDKKETLK